MMLPIVYGYFLYIRSYIEFCYLTKMCISLNQLIVNINVALTMCQDRCLRVLHLNILLSKYTLFKYTTQYILLVYSVILFVLKR